MYIVYLRMKMYSGGIDTYNTENVYFFGFCNLASEQHF